MLNTDVTSSLRCSGRLVSACRAIRGGWTARRMLRSAGLGLLLGVTAIALAGCAAGQSGPATDVGSTAATANGNVYSSIDATSTYWFDYGKTVFYGNETPRRTIAIADRNAHPVSEALTGLDPGTTYHYKTCAQNPGYPVYCGADQSFATSQVSSLSIDAQPALYPAFDPAVSDYVTRCGSQPVTISVAAPPNTTVAVAGQPAQGGAFSQQVPLSAGQAFGFSTRVGGQTSAFNVRCLPDDFPEWTYTRSGTPRASFYITTPQGGIGSGGRRTGAYVVIFDTHGVPVWWREASAFDAKLLPDGTLGWYTDPAGGTTTSGFEVHRLDGSLVHTWQTIGSKTDLHDFQLLPDGDALMLTYPPRPGTVDLSPYGGPSTNATVLDAEIQEVTPNGTLVWSWNTRDHIPLSETGQRWWPGVPTTLPDGRKAYDYAHINSIEQTGSTIVASFRHFDAVYAIDRSTGNVLWKLGGTLRPESLTVVGDPQTGLPLGGQHYARLLPDGTLTLHDNNTFLGPVPRAVRYRLDLSAGTAQFVEQVTDPDVTASVCCGSAQRLADGTWVIDWGSTNIITEFGPDGSRDFKLTFPFLSILYRVAVITGASPGIGDLRAGMDAMAAQPVQSDAGRTSAGPGLTDDDAAALGIAPAAR